jgi:hypothetical protein
MAIQASWDAKTSSSSASEVADDDMSVRKFAPSELPILPRACVTVV